jgi:hypothetical protein
MSTTSKTAWLDRIERARQTWEEIVAAVGAAGMEQPVAGGDWTFKDIAGHLNGWRIRTVARLEAAVRDEAPRPAPWPADLDDGTDAGVDAINDWLHGYYSTRSTDEILAEAREQFDRLRAAVAALPEEALETPGRYPWLGDSPLSTVLDGSLGHLHEEHEPGLRAWLADRPR